MQIVLIPILEKMVDFYQQPIGGTRFKEYLMMLQGSSKDDMVLPIAGYNPMAKDNMKTKLHELIAQNAEVLMEEEIDRINNSMLERTDRTIHVVLNLVDDVGGSWSNRFITDFNSKFTLQALVKRNFCTPCFWTSEAFSAPLIRKETRASILRTLYWIEHGAPKTLQQAVEQELAITRQMEMEEVSLSTSELDKLKAFYNAHAASDNYSIIFNFFYGDEASTTLAYPTFGLPPNAGFDFVHYLSNEEMSI